MKTLIAIALSLIGLQAGLAAERPGRFQHFITRQGNKLYDGEKEFRFIGANMPGLVLPYDWTLYLLERLYLPTPWEQEDAFKTLDQMNLRVVRTWNLPIRKPDEEPKPWHYVLGPGQFNEEAFKCLDHLFALANKYGVRVILDLTAESGDYLGGIGTYAAHRGKARKEFYTDPQLKAGDRPPRAHAHQHHHRRRLPRRQGGARVAVRQRNAQRARRVALRNGGVYQEPRQEPSCCRDAPPARPAVARGPEH